MADYYAKDGRKLTEQEAQDMPRPAEGQRRDWVKDDEGNYREVLTSVTNEGQAETPPANAPAGNATLPIGLGGTGSSQPLPLSLQGTTATVKPVSTTEATTEAPKATTPVKQEAAAKPAESGGDAATLPAKPTVEKGFEFAPPVGSYDREYTHQEGGVTVKTWLKGAEKVKEQRWDSMKSWLEDGYEIQEFYLGPSLVGKTVRDMAATAPERGISAAPVGLTVGETQSVKLATGEEITGESWNALAPDMQQEVYKGGIAQFTQRQEQAARDIEGMDLYQALLSGISTRTLRFAGYAEDDIKAAKAELDKLADAQKQDIKRFGVAEINRRQEAATEATKGMDLYQAVLNGVDETTLRYAGWRQEDIDAAKAELAKLPQEDKAYLKEQGAEKFNVRPVPTALALPEKPKEQERLADFPIDEATLQREGVSTVPEGPPAQEPQRDFPIDEATLQQEAAAVEGGETEAPSISQTGPTVTLNTGEQVTRESWESLTTEQQDALKIAGVEKFNLVQQDITKRTGDDVIQAIAKGTVDDKDLALAGYRPSDIKEVRAWLAQLDDDDRALVADGGVALLNQSYAEHDRKFRAENTQLPDGNWVPNSWLNQEIPPKAKENVQQYGLAILDTDKLAPKEKFERYRDLGYLDNPKGEAVYAGEDKGEPTYYLRPFANTVAQEGEVVDAYGRPLLAPARPTALQGPYDRKSIGGEPILTPGQYYKWGGNYWSLDANGKPQLYQPPDIPVTSMALSLIPVVGTTRTWRTDSNYWRAVNVASDALFFAPYFRTVATGARALVIGKDAVRIEKAIAEARITKAMIEAEHARIAEFNKPLANASTRALAAKADYVDTYLEIKRIEAIRSPEIMTEAEKATRLEGLRSSLIAKETAYKQSYADLRAVSAMEAKGEGIYLEGAASKVLPVDPAGDILATKRQLDAVFTPPESLNVNQLSKEVADLKTQIAQSRSATIAADSANAPKLFELRSKVREAKDALNRAAKEKAPQDQINQLEQRLREADNALLTAQQESTTSSKALSQLSQELLVKETQLNRAQVETLRKAQSQARKELDYLNETGAPEESIRATKAKLLQINTQLFEATQSLPISYDKGRFAPPGGGYRRPPIQVIDPPLRSGGGPMTEIRRVDISEKVERPKLPPIGSGVVKAGETKVATTQAISEATRPAGQVGIIEAPLAPVGVGVAETFPPTTGSLKLAPAPIVQPATALPTPISGAPQAREIRPAPTPRGELPTVISPVPAPSAVSSTTVIVPTPDEKPGLPQPRPGQAAKPMPVTTAAPIATPIPETAPPTPVTGATISPVQQVVVKAENLAGKLQRTNPQAANAVRASVIISQRSDLTLAQKSYLLQTLTTRITAITPQQRHQIQTLQARLLKTMPVVQPKLRKITPTKPEPKTIEIKKTPQPVKTPMPKITKRPPVRPPRRTDFAEQPRRAIGRGPESEWVGWRQGIMFRAKNVQTGEELYSRHPFKGLPGGNGKGSAYRSSRVLSQRQGRAQARTDSMGAFDVNVHPGGGLSYRKRKGRRNGR